MMINAYCGKAQPGTYSYNWATELCLFLKLSQIPFTKIALVKLTNRLSVRHSLQIQHLGFR